MAIRGTRALIAVVVGSVACGSSEPPEPAVCEPAIADGALAPPPGAKPGEPYRWLSRSWRSPLGLTIRVFGLAIEGTPVTGIHQVEID
ncbi:MAG TPA: hypothetical protein VGD80_11630, partial [Kofleriaceae bacterium]